MKWLRRLLLALGVSLLVGFAIGTVIRLRMERPRHYIGQRVLLPLAPLPLDIFDSGTPVLDARHHEEQVGEAIQVA